MSRIAVLVSDLFEDSEYLEPVKAFKKAIENMRAAGAKIIYAFF